MIIQFLNVLREANNNSFFAYWSRVDLRNLGPLESTSRHQPFLMEKEGIDVILGGRARH